MAQMFKESASNAEDMGSYNTRVHIKTTRGQWKPTWNIF